MRNRFLTAVLLGGVACSLVACKRHEESSSPDLRPDSKIQKSETLSGPEKPMLGENTNINTLKDSATNSGITGGAGGGGGAPASGGTNADSSKIP